MSTKKVLLLSVGFLFAVVSSPATVFGTQNMHQQYRVPPNHRASPIIPPPRSAQNPRMMPRPRQMTHPRDIHPRTHQQIEKPQTKHKRKTLPSESKLQSRDENYAKDSDQTENNSDIRNKSNKSTHQNQKPDHAPVQKRRKTPQKKESPSMGPQHHRSTPAPRISPPMQPPFKQPGMNIPKRRIGPRSGYSTQNKNTSNVPPNMQRPSNLPPGTQMSPFRGRGMPFTGSKPSFPRTQPNTKNSPTHYSNKNAARSNSPSAPGFEPITRDMDNNEYNSVRDSIVGLTRIWRDGSYGYINEFGETVIDPADYDRVGTFDNGSVTVWKDETSFELNTEGERIN